MFTLKLELISPQQIVFEGEVLSVMLPGSEGDMTILPGHARLASLINPGMIEVVDAGGNNLRVFVSKAFAEITEKAVTVLSERVVVEEELSQEHIDKEIVRLQTIAETSNDETSRTNALTLIWRLEQIRLGLRG